MSARLQIVGNNGYLRLSRGQVTLLKTFRRSAQRCKQFVSITAASRIKQPLESFVVSVRLHGRSDSGCTQKTCCSIFILFLKGKKMLFFLFSSSYLLRRRKSKRTLLNGGIRGLEKRIWEIPGQKINKRCVTFFNTGFLPFQPGQKTVNKFVPKI